MAIHKYISLDCDPLALQPLDGKPSSINLGFYPLDNHPSPSILNIDICYSLLDHYDLRILSFPLKKGLGKHEIGLDESVRPEIHP